MTARDKRRLRVNQLQQAVTTQRNAASETNKIYLKLRKELNDEIDGRMANQGIDQDTDNIDTI